jgi:hypothetical protein
LIASMKCPNDGEVGGDVATDRHVRGRDYRAVAVANWTG